MYFVAVFRGIPIMIFLCFLLLLQNVQGSENSAELSEKSNLQNYQFRSKYESSDEPTSNESEEDDKDTKSAFDFYSPFSKIARNKESLGIGFQKPKMISENLRSLLRNKYSDKYSFIPDDEEQKNKNIRYGFQASKSEQEVSDEKKKDEKEKSNYWKDQEDKVPPKKYLPIEKEVHVKSKIIVLSPKYENKSSGYSIYEDSPKQRHVSEERARYPLRDIPVKQPESYEYYSNPHYIEDKPHPYQPVVNEWESGEKRENSGLYSGNIEGSTNFHDGHYPGKFSSGIGEIPPNYEGSYNPEKALHAEYEEDMRKKENFLQHHERKLAEITQKHRDAYNQFMGKHLRSNKFY